MLGGVLLGNAILTFLISFVFSPSILPTQISLWSFTTLRVILSCVHGLELTGNGFLLYWCWKGYYTLNISSTTNILKRTLLLSLCLNAPYTFAQTIFSFYDTNYFLYGIQLLCVLGLLCSIILCLKFLCWILNCIRKNSWQKHFLSALNFALMLGCIWVLLSRAPYPAYSHNQNTSERETLFQFPLWSITQRTITTPNKSTTYQIIFTSLFLKAWRSEEKKDNTTYHKEGFKVSTKLQVSGSKRATSQ